MGKLIQLRTNTEKNFNEYQAWMKSEAEQVLKELLKVLNQNQSRLSFTGKIHKPLQWPDLNINLGYQLGFLVNDEKIFFINLLYLKPLIKRSLFKKELINENNFQEAKLKEGLFSKGIYYLDRYLLTAVKVMLKNRGYDMSSWGWAPKYWRDITD